MYSLAATLGTTTGAYSEIGPLSKLSSLPPLFGNQQAFQNGQAIGGYTAQADETAAQAWMVVDGVASLPKLAETLPATLDELYQNVMDLLGSGEGDAPVPTVNRVPSGLQPLPAEGMLEMDWYGTKIYGAAQDTGTFGHDITVLDQVKQMAASGDYEYITMNRSWKVSTGLPRPPAICVRTSSAYGGTERSMRTRCCRGSRPKGRRWRSSTKG